MARPKNAAVLKIAPFKMDVTHTKSGFTLGFRGVGRKGEPIEVRLEFPHWWLDHALDRLRTVRRRGS